MASRDRQLTSPEAYARTVPLGVMGSAPTALNAELRSLAMAVFRRKRRRYYTRRKWSKDAFVRKPCCAGSRPLDWRDLPSLPSPFPGRSSGARSLNRATTMAQRPPCVAISPTCSGCNGKVTSSSDSVSTSLRRTRCAQMVRCDDALHRTTAERQSPPGRFGALGSEFAVGLEG